MTQFQGMSSAPLDRPVLLKHIPQLFDFRTQQFRGYGLKIEQAQYIDGRWEPWGGSPAIRSSTTLKPVGWMELPE